MSLSQEKSAWQRAPSRMPATCAGVSQVTQGLCQSWQYKTPPSRPNPSVNTLSPVLGSFHHRHVSPTRLQGQWEAQDASGSAPSPLTTFMVAQGCSSPQAQLMLSRLSRIHCILEGGLARRNIWTKPLAAIIFRVSSQANVKGRSPSTSQDRLCRCEHGGGCKRMG